jgi:hypothetical protein
MHAGENVGVLDEDSIINQILTAAVIEGLKPNRLWFCQNGGRAGISPAR